MQILKQSTASQAIKLGPFVDSTDGVTAETGLTIANTDIQISKAGAAFGNKNSGGGTHDADGWYTATLDATDTATVGTLDIQVTVSGALPVMARFQVVEEAIYDGFFAASAGALATAAALTTVDTVVDGIQTDLSNATDGLGAIKTAVDTVDGIVDNILVDTAEIGAAGAGLTALATATNLATVDTVVDGIQTDLSNATDGLGAIKAAVDTVDGIVDDILVDTAEIGAAGAGLTAVPWNASWDAEVQSECTDALSAYDPPTNTEMEARTLVAASYFDPAADTVANVTTVATVTNEVTADMTKISGSATAADNLEASALGIVSGACEGTPTTTVIQTDLAETTDDHYIGRVVVFTSGNTAGEATDITDYTGSTGTLTVTAVTTAPAASDTFVIV